MRIDTSTFLWFLRFLVMLLLISILGCKEGDKKDVQNNSAETPKTYVNLQLLKNKPDSIKTPQGMVWIPGGIFLQGADSSDDLAMGHEHPVHPVALDGFFMDSTEVTNAQFARFVEQTGYLTVAERPIDWDEMKKQLPPGTPKPHDSVLQPGSLIFKKPSHPIKNLNDYSQWWEWKVGVNWKHPQGPKSTLEGKENHPVVHIAHEDALAYCKWAGRRLPTEAEWEYAARGGSKNARFPWGNDKGVLNQHANTWSGEFPTENNNEDGFTNKAPVASYTPNGYGLYDMMGNVWEWTSDWYDVNYYKNLAQKNDTVMNPEGPKMGYNPYNPYEKEKVIRGGSFLCAENYCASYRVSARMANSIDSSQEHLGFRTVLSVDMLRKP